VWRVDTIVAVATTPRIITAQELDEMTPDERAASFADRVVRDLDDLPSDFRARVEARARKVAAEQPSPPLE
jgi:hypothetical protein